MNHIYYNGISLNFLETVKYEKTAVYNGLDYLYTTHRLTVRATFNPTTQYDGYPVEVVRWHGKDEPALLRNPSEVGPIIDPVVESNHIALSGALFKENRPGAYTAQAVQHQLLTPRGNFRWVQDGIAVLTSPLPGFKTDSKNGPFPIACTVTPLGSKTWLVDWTFETHISECPRFSRDFLPILSNTWAMEHDIDQDHYTVRRCVGKTVFDAQAVRGLRLNANGDDPEFADSLRQHLFFPIPEGFKRQAVKVRLSEDGLTLDWSYEDKEMPFAFVGTTLCPYVTRIEAFQNVQTGPIGFDGAASAVGGLAGGSTGKGIVDGVMSLLDYFKAAGQMIASDSWIQSKLGGLLSPEKKNSVDKIRMQWATSHHTFVVKVWGDRRASRADLENVAREVIRKRRAGLLLTHRRILPSGTKITHDVAGTFVQGEETYIGGPIFNNPANDPLPSKFLGQVNVFPAHETEGVLKRDTLNGAYWPKPPNDAGTRGTYEEYLASQFLSSPCNTSASTPPRTLTTRPTPGLGTPPPTPPQDQPPNPAPTRPPPDIGPPTTTR